MNWWKELEIPLAAMVFMSAISVPYLDWWGFLVGPTMGLMLAWAYYSMAFVMWIGSTFKRLIDRA